VENTGSTARDHLANERTFLSWCNTGMTFFGAGVALFSSFELFDENSTTRTGVIGSSSGGMTLRSRLSGSLNPLCPRDTNHKPAGGWKVVEAASLLVLNGAIFVSYATFQYFRVQRALKAGMFPQNKYGVLAVVGSTGSISVLALYLLAHDRKLPAQLERQLQHERQRRLQRDA